MGSLEGPGSVLVSHRERSYFRVTIYGFDYMYMCEMLP